MELSSPPAQSAGVVPQANYNSFTATTFSAQSLNDSNGNATTATLTGGTSTNYSNGGPGANTDQILNSGLAQWYRQRQYTFTVKDVPYGTYMIGYEMTVELTAQGRGPCSKSRRSQTEHRCLRAPSPVPGSPGYTYSGQPSVV